MAFAVRAYVDIYWVPEGTGGVTMVPGALANSPGYGQAQGPGPGGSAQTMHFQAAEAIPGGDSPTLANINTALTNIANDLAGASGAPQITPALLAQIVAWKSGGP
jgi:hypothetical protein